MAITNSTIAQAVNDLVDYWDSFNVEYAAWLTGVVGGGPNLDGEYPLTDYLGNVTLTLCPAALEASVNGVVDSANTYATAAQAAQTAAEAAQTAAELAETNSDVSEAQALAYRDAALAAQTAAESARTTAIAQADVSILNSGYASEWAITIEDTLVSVAAGGNGTTDYSALHWSAKSALSASAASTSETNAGTSETNAATSETNAATSATDADLERQYAAEWANKAEDSLISVAAGGDNVDDYSALHWAQKAEDFAAAADLLSTANEIITGNWSFDHASGLNIGAGIITAAKITNWDTAYGWGDHAGLYATTAAPTFTGGITTTGLVDNDVMIYFNMDRPWQFMSKAEDASNQLELQSINSKSFIISDGSGNVMFNFKTVSGQLECETINAVGGAMIIKNAADAYLQIEADTDNVTETDNAYIQLLQDGQAVEVIHGFSGAANIDAKGNVFTGAISNGMNMHHRVASGNIGFGVNGVCAVRINNSNDLILDNDFYPGGDIFMPGTGSGKLTSTTTAGSIRISNGTQWADIGCRNTSYCHMDTSGSSGFYSYQDITVVGSKDIAKASHGNYLYHQGTYNASQAGGVTFSTSTRSGGVSGDIWFKYT